MVDDIDLFYRRYYGQEIKEFAQKYPNEQRSLSIDYNDIYQFKKFDQDVLDDILENYTKIIPLFEDALQVYDIPIDISLRNANVRIHNLPEELEVDISDIRGEHVGNFLPIRGIVSQKRDVKERVMSMEFSCEMCGVRETMKQFGGSIQTPGKCDCGYDAWRPLDTSDETEYSDVQILELQEPPEAADSVNGARIPMELSGDLTGNAVEGERITANALVRLDTDDFTGHGNPDRDRDFYLECYSIDKHDTQFSDIEISNDDKERIFELAESDDIYERLIGSLAPWIVPDDKLRKVKLAVLLQLLGGVEVDLPNGESIRGDINVYLIGDAGTGKTQIGKHAKAIAPLGVYTSGKGATPAGMTATATETNDGWKLDAGALVVASGGFAFVDEFDKMDKSVHQSMHEALESQQIPISKAGINTVLNAKTTVLASSNPIGGEVDRFSPIQEQVEIERPLLSRFDLIFLLNDKVDEEKDRWIAEKQHSLADGDGNETNELEIDEDLLQKYIAYARTNLEPTYSREEVKQELVNMYVEKRQENEDEEDAPTPITARVNDSYRRLAQASARARLSEDITMADVERVKNLVNTSLGDTAFDEMGNMDGNKARGGMPKSQRDRINSLEQLIGDVEEEYDDGAPIDIVLERADQAGMDQSKAEHEIEKLMHKGKLYEPSTDTIRTTD
ncbi:ATP-binding protein [Natrinema sp. H-ect4]|uniref:ATP-binding protein n=1 Tax=Natrinema sp. H-ect4 TaxID=3242699 RepID=UPI0035A97B92